MKNHDLFLALDNQTVKLLSIQLINWISSAYSCEHIEYNNASFYSTIMSMLTILQHQLSLSSWACQLFSSISLSSHTQFSWLNFFWFKFSCSFSVISLFSWSHSHVEILIRFTVTNSYFVLSYALLRDFLFALFFIIFCLLVWDFSQVLCYKSLFDLMQHSWKRFLFASVTGL